MSEQSPSIFSHVTRQLLVLLFLPFAVPLCFLLVTTMWTLVLVGAVYLDAQSNWKHHFGATKRLYKRFNLK